MSFFHWFVACVSWSAIAGRMMHSLLDTTDREGRSHRSEALSKLLLALQPSRVLASNPVRPELSRKSHSPMMGRKFENNKARMAKTALQNTKKASLIGKKIKVACANGETDPAKNSALAAVIKEANALNVKREVVERGIKAASQSKDGENFKQLTYEFYGFGGAGFIVNALSDNSKRTITDVQIAMKKKKTIKLADAGSVMNKFERKGRLTLNEEITEDRMIEIALEADVDDVVLAAPCPEIRGDNENVKSVILTDYAALGAMQKALDSAGIEFAGSLVHEPLFVAEGLTAEDVQENLELMDLITAVDDVDSIEHNMPLEVLQNHD